MQKFIIPLLLCSMPLLALAQNKEGQVLYTETLKIQIQLPDDAPEEMKKMVPPTRSNRQVLLFNEKETLYRSVNEDTDKDLDIKHNDGEGNDVQIKIVQPKNILYRNLQEDKVVESRDFMGRTFLIKDETKTYKWKLAPDKKMILGYNCQKAILQDSAKNVVVWFTPDIAVPAGPDTYNGLPGLILEIDVDNGARTAVATKIEFKKLEKKAIVAPTKGKSTSRVEFEKIVAEKMKEMNAENGGGGMKIIIKEDRN